MRVDARQLARVGYTYLGRLYTEMDCQAFVERCLADCGMRINLPGSNAWYRRMDWTGTPEECKAQFGKIPVGAFLFILNTDGKEPEKYQGDGIGNASHIGIYTGERTGAIHSSASRGCVSESRFAGKTVNGGWNRVGLWRSGVMYDSNVDSGVKGGIAMDAAAKVVLPDGKSGTVHMRRGASTNDKIIEDVPAGDKVNILEDQGKWCKISWNGKNGWMMSNFLEYDMPSAGEIDEDKASQIDSALKIIEAQVEIIGQIVGRG